MRTFIAALALGVGLLVAPVAASAPALAKHPCTRTSSGACIRGGEFCKQSEYGHYGWDAKGRRYKCTGSHSHPHWEK